jgi:hypothetical protein
MASPNLPTSITPNVTTGHSEDHETAHTLLNAFDTTIPSGSEGEALVMGADGRYAPGVVSGSGAVDSVNTQTGVVVLDADDIDDTSTTNKFATQDELDDISTALQPADGVGYQIWNGTSWSTRPTGYGHVEAFSDGTRGSTRDADATAPTGAVDGDRWWTVDA